jgi:hypothetical protein
LYAITPAEIFATLELPASPVSGYSVTINWRHWFEIAQGKRIYPPQPYPLAILPKGWHLSVLEYTLDANDLLYGFNQFIEGNLLNQPEQVDRFETLLRAMSWYNRSFSRFSSEEERIVHLAVAFEILFHQQEDSRSSIQKEILTHLHGLFGKAPRLDEWVAQFYNERSNIVHQGFATRSRFTIGDKRPTEQQLLMDSLSTYGRRLLRMCIFNILHATLLAEEVNLNAWFEHDKERLQKICKILKDKSVPAEKRLQSIINIVYDLGEIWVHYLHREKVDLGTVHAAGTRLINVFLEVHTEIRPELCQDLEHIVNLGLDKPLETVDAYWKLSQKIGRACHLQRTVLAEKAVSSFGSFCQDGNILIAAARRLLEQGADLTCKLVFNLLSLPPVHPRQ